MVVKKIYNVKSEPEYGGGRLLGWRLTWRVGDRQKTSSPEFRFFKEGLFFNSYKKMCRYKTRHFRNVDNIAPIGVSGIKTVMYNTKQSKSRMEDGAVIQSMKDGDVIARYVIMVTYPGNLTTRFIGPRKGLVFKKSTNVIDVSYQNGNTVVAHAWDPAGFLEPEDSLHAAEMFHSTMVARVARNANSHTK